eukprot:PRCOL_00000465-RA
MEGVVECPSGTARGIASRWASSGPPCGGRCMASHGVPGFCWCTLSTEARAAFATGSAGLVSGGASPPPWPASSLPLAAQVQERSDANVLPPTPAAERHDAGPDGRAAARSFDLDPRYGPASGLTRRERHARALGLGLKPPALSDEALSYPPTGAATRWL